MIEYKAKLMQNLYKVFKKPKTHILIIDIKLSIDEKFDLKVGYSIEVFLDFNCRKAKYLSSIL